MSFESQQELPLGQEQAKPKENRRSGIDKRFARLTAKNYALQASNLELETRVVQLEAQVEELLHVLDVRRRIVEAHAEMLEDECRNLEAQAAAKGAVNDIRTYQHN